MKTSPTLYDSAV